MVRMMTPAEQRAEHERERREFADRWTGGDTDAAEAILGAFPYYDYYDTPTWGDAHYAVRLILATAKEAR